MGGGGGGDQIRQWGVGEVETKLDSVHIPELTEGGWGGWRPN